MVTKVVKAPESANLVLSVIIKNKSGQLISSIHAFSNVWKYQLEALISESCRVYWLKSDDEKIPIIVSALELAKKFPLLEVPKEFNNYMHVYSVDSEQHLHSLPIETFMHLVIEEPHGISSPTDEKKDDRGTVDDLKKLQASFKHSISAIGHAVVDYIKVNVLESFSSWNLTVKKLIAPIASLSQNSGTGKSKLSAEITQDCPGFYIVTRLDPSIEQPATGYPKQNALSQLLIELTSYSDPISKSLDNDHDYYFNSQTGKILFLFS